MSRPSIVRFLLSMSGSIDASWVFFRRKSERRFFLTFDSLSNEDDMIFLLRSGVVAWFAAVVVVSWYALRADLISASPSTACKAAFATVSGPSSRRAIARARSPSVLGARTVSRSDLSSKPCRSLPLEWFDCRSDIVNTFYHRNHAFPMVFVCFCAV